MSAAFGSYAATLVVYLGINTIACWGLNLQFGVGGVMNFAFILFQAMGAYITAVLTLPRATTASAETYMLGWHLPWPLPLAGAAVAGAALALAIGAFALPPQRRDFQATVMLVVSIIAATLVITDQAGSTGDRACSASRSRSWPR
ncbi:MAG: ABC transporter permease subunit [Streptosporangiaceae bacterium]